MGKTLRIGLSAGLLAVLSSVPARVSADYSGDAGTGAATVAANVFYIPAKLTYATLGGITGGLAYLLTGTNKEIAERVWKPSMGGDYVVKPSHIRREETLYFSAPVPPADDPGLAEQPFEQPLQ